MTKKLISFLTALAFCGFAYAAPVDDDEDEYEEDDAPAQVEKKSKKSRVVEQEEEEEEEEEEAPKKPSKPKEPRKAVDAGAGMLGLQLDLVEALASEGTHKFYFTYKIASDMEASLIFGLGIHGSSTLELNNVKTELDNGVTDLYIGAGFDFFLTKQLLPISVGAELFYGSLSNSVDATNGLAMTERSVFEIDITGGFRANLVSNLYLTGKLGMSLKFNSWEETVALNALTSAVYDCSSTDFGFKVGAYLGWFFL